MKKVPATIKSIQVLLIFHADKLVYQQNLNELSLTESLISMEFLRAKCKCPVLNEKQIIKILTAAAVKKLKPPDISKGTSQHKPQNLNYP